MIHASKKATKYITDYFPIEWTVSIHHHEYVGNICHWTDMPSNAIIGYVEIADIAEATDSLWDGGPDQLKWILKNAYLFDEPILNVKGKLHLFDFDLDENNLPPAHKAELKSIRGEGDELVVPTTRKNFEHLQTLGEDNVLPLFLSEETEPILLTEEGKPINFNTVRFECEGNVLRFKLKPETELVYYLDDDGNNIKVFSLYHEEPIEYQYYEMLIEKRL